jgi:hypothetical protein
VLFDKAKMQRSAAMTKFRSGTVWVAGVLAVAALGGVFVKSDVAPVRSAGVLYEVRAHARLISVAACS